MATQQQIDSVLSDYRWNEAASFGSTQFLTYSFMQSVPNYDSVAEKPGFRAFTATEMDVSRQVLSSWAAVAGVVLIEVSDAVAGDIRLGAHDFTGTAYNDAAG